VPPPLVSLTDNYRGRQGCPHVACTGPVARTPPRYTAMTLAGSLLLLSFYQIVSRDCVSFSFLCKFATGCGVGTTLLPLNLMEFFLFLYSYSILFIYLFFIHLFTCAQHFGQRKMC
jgi:hypothetical protein